MKTREAALVEQRHRIIEQIAKQRAEIGREISRYATVFGKPVQVAQTIQRRIVSRPLFWGLIMVVLFQRRPLFRLIARGWSIATTAVWLKEWFAKTYGLFHKTEKEQVQEKVK